MTGSADVVVIGGGSTGTSVAWQLARQGAGRVVLLEREAIAAGGTGWSSGIVRQHYTHPVLARMALQSLRVFEQFDEVVGGDVGFHRTGFLVLVSPGDAESLAANVAMQREVGIDAALLTPEQVSELEPRLMRDDIGLAAWEPASGYADPVSTANAFAAAARRHGAEIRVGESANRITVGPLGVESVETSTGQIATRTVVVAAGYRTRDLVLPLGLDLTMTPLRHDFAIVRRTDDFGPSHPVIADLVNGCYFKPEGEQLTLIGTVLFDEGVVDPDVEQSRDPHQEALVRLAGFFCRRFPTQEEAGLRRGFSAVLDCTPDHQPYLGPVPGVPGLCVAAGFSGHGFKLAPVIGEMVASAITGAATAFDIELFSPYRLHEQRPIRSEHVYAVSAPV